MFDTSKARRNYRCNLWLGQAKNWPTHLGIIFALAATGISTGRGFLEDNDKKQDMLFGWEVTVFLISQVFEVARMLYLISNIRGEHKINKARFNQVIEENGKDIIKNIAYGKSNGLAKGVYTPLLLQLALGFGAAITSIYFFRFDNRKVSNAINSIAPTIATIFNEVSNARFEEEYNDLKLYNAGQVPPGR